MAEEAKSTPPLDAFIHAVEALCGEANEAARLSVELFSEPQLKEVRRTLARCMELMDSVVFPVVHAQYPGAHHSLYPGHEHWESDA